MNIIFTKHFLFYAVIFFSVCSLAGGSLKDLDCATPKERQLVREAAAYENDQEYSDAAKCYRECGDLQKDAASAAGYYLREADCLMKADMTRRAAQVYQKLVKSYLFHIPVEQVMENLRILAHNYEIGKGTLWSINDPTAAIELYKLIVKYQPAIEHSLKDRLILAEKLAAEEEFEEAVNLLQETIKLTPRSPEPRLTMAKLLYTLSQRSDGDGVRARSAIREAKSFLKNAPENDPRRAEAEALMTDCRNLEAERLYEMSLFYLNKYHYRPAVARRYLHDIIRDYANTPAAAKAAKALEGIRHPNP